MSYSLIFDMDGTLFQTNSILELALDDTFAQLRNMKLWDRQTPIDVYRKIMGVPLPVVWENLLPEHSESVRIQANDWFHEHLISNISSGKGELYPNVIEVLQELKKSGHAIYIASNGQIEYLKAIVDYYPLNQWVVETFSIQHIASLNKSDLVGHIKARYNIGQGAVIGDRISDFKAAHDNQLTAIGCHFDFAQEEELAHADKIIQHFSELPSVLEALMLK